MFKSSVVRTRFTAVMAYLFVFLMVSVPAWAAPTVDDIWTAVDLSGISAKIIPIAVLIVGVALVGTALALGVKSIKKARGAL